MLPDVLLISGAILVSIGAGLVYIPAGVIVAGLLCIVGAFKAAK